MPENREEWTHHLREAENKAEATNSAYANALAWLAKNHKQFDYWGIQEKKKELNALAIAARRAERSLIKARENFSLWERYEEKAKQ